MKITIDPKKQFQSDIKRASAHQDIMANPQFHEAARAAMLAYQYRVCVGEPVNPAAISVRLRGAQEFLNELLNLGEPETTSQFEPIEHLTPPEDWLKLKQPQMGHQ